VNSSGTLLIEFERRALEMSTTTGIVRIGPYPAGTTLTGVYAATAADQVSCPFAVCRFSKHLRVSLAQHLISAVRAVSS
jgi:hypothetical protein